MLPAASIFSFSLDWTGLLRLTISLGLSVFIFGGILRLVFGKGSPVVKAVSACIHIALIYLNAITLYTLVPQLREALPMLPFISIGSDSFFLWDLSGLTASSFFPGLLRLFLLAFWVNLLEDLVPKGERFLHWCFLRLLIVYSALALYAGICSLIEIFAPQIFGQWAAAIVITIWLLIGILGLSKGMLALIAAVFNPVLGILFAFFFTSRFGSQFTKAIATCLLTLAVFYALFQSGFTGFTFSQLSIAAYGPSCLVVLAVLFLFRTFL